jgi:hypothetical protein
VIARSAADAEQLGGGPDVVEGGGHGR